MKNKLAILVLSFLPIMLAFGDSFQEVRSRIAERVPAIKELWATQQVGETNNGYLKVLGSITPEQELIVNAENADRKQLYIHVSKQYGDPLDKVERANAPRIQGQVPAGTMIQAEDGTWGPKG